jgi:hypothetical protein
MSCEHLICAQCAGPVVEGRCPACRHAKADVHHDAHPGHGVPLLLLAVILTLLLMLALHLAH